MMNFKAALLAVAILPTMASADCLSAYWIPFAAELYTPESEASIESRAFEKNSIPTSIADSLAPENFPTTQTQSYDPEDVRAIIHSTKEDIYIDRFGWIRQGTVYGKANPQEIEKKLSTSCSKK